MAIGIQYLVAPLLLRIRVEKILYSTDAASFLRETAGSYPDRCYVLCDSNTRKECLPVLQRLSGGLFVHILEIPAGEASKSVSMFATLVDDLLAQAAGRDALLFCLGGGVVGDLGGFLASVYKRGIGLVQIPTSLLAMVDASVGGKNGLNAGHYKNMIGTFSTPEAVLIFPEMLETLPERHVRNGFAEMLKHGLILDRPYWDQLRSIHPQAGALAGMVKRSIELKQFVTSQDPFDRGMRQILNFGHTIGHAMEAYALEQGLDCLHGEAIALGMRVEACLSVSCAGLPIPEAVEADRVLLNIFPAPNWELPDADLVWERMQHDKKNSGRRVLMALLRQIGACEPGIPVTYDAFRSAYHTLIP